MPAEKRTRVEVFLPIRPDIPAFQIVSDWLAEELAYARGGATLTTPFTGLYKSTVASGVIRDTITVLFVDFNLDLDIPEHGMELTVYLDGIRRLLVDVLHEEEIWIVYHSVERVVGSGY